MTTPVNGFSVAASPNDRSLVVWLTPGTGSTTTVGYLSASGNGYCYGSTQAQCHVA